MSSPGDQYVWIGPAGGAWGTAGDWEDLTAGTDPASTSPGPADAAAIEGPEAGPYLLVNGSGNALNLALTGAVAFSGTIVTGLANLSQINQTPSALELTAGGFLQAGSFGFAGPNGSVLVNGRNARLLVGGTLSGGGDDQMDVQNGGSLLAGDVVLQPFDQLGVLDGGSAIEIGSGGRAVAGAIVIDPGASVSGSGSLLAPMVDFGTLLSTGLSVSGALSGSGAIVVTPGGSFTDLAAAGGSLQVVVDSAGLLDLGTTIGSLVAITLGGTGDVLEFGVLPYANIHAPATLAMAGTISGFASGDVILGDLAAAPSTASFTQTASNAGLLTLLGADGSQLGSLDLAGFYAGQSLVVTQLPIAGQFQVNLAEAGTYGISQGTTGNDQYVWTGLAGGNWGDGRNWQDLDTANTIAPGAADAVAIEGLSDGPYLVVTGSGNAQNLALTGAVAFAGTIVTFLVNLSQINQTPGALELTAGGFLQTGSFGFAGPDGSVLVDGHNARLLVGGTLDGAGDDQVDAENGGSLLAGAAVLQPFDQLGVLDTGSAIEIGGGGGGVAGDIVIDSGATVSGSGSLLGPLADFGTLLSSGLWGSGPLSGSGTIMVLSGGSFTDLAAAGGSLQVMVATEGTLDLGTTIAPGIAITLGGAGDLLEFGILPYANTLAPAMLAMAGTISGFASGDVILGDLAAAPSTASFTQTASNAGLLTLLGANGSQFGSLDLSGTYAGQSFVVTQLPIAGQFQVNLAEAGTYGISQGTSSNDQYVWTGLAGGNWGDGRNWQDLDTANTIAPGAADAVAIDGLSGGPYLVVTGSGNAQNLALTGAVAFAGTIVTFLVNLSQINQTPGALELTAGGILQAGSFGFAGPDGSVLADGRNARLLVGGTLDGAGDDQVEVENGGSLLAGAVMLQPFDQLGVLDTGSAIEIGGGGGAIAGNIVIDAGATVSGSGSLLGPLVDFGTLLSSGLWGSGALSGSGAIMVLSGGSFTDLAAAGGSLQVMVGAGGTIDLGTTIGSGVAISLGGSGDVLAFGILPYANLHAPAALDVAGTISGFVTGDVILADLAVAPSHVAFAQTASNAGLLTLLSANGSQLGSLDLAGIHSGQSFAVTPLPIAGQFELEIVPCFAEGTRIATPQGECAVEALEAGQRVRTANGRFAPILWIGQRHIDCVHHLQPDAVQPVRVAAGAFAPGIPKRDLFLSPDHAVFAGGSLIPVRALRNGASIAQIAVPDISYFHVALDRHDLLLAEGLAVESYLDTGNRQQFQNATSAAWLPDQAIPLCRDATKARRHLITRLPALGYVFGEDADPHLRLGARRLWSALLPLRPAGWQLRCLLPERCRTIRLVCHAGVPAGRLSSTDCRSLGARVDGVTVDGHVLPLGSRAFGRGFYPIETKGSESWRWTDGDAVLQLPPGARLLDIRIAALMPAWIGSQGRSRNSRPSFTRGTPSYATMSAVA